MARILFEREKEMAREVFKKGDLVLLTENQLLERFTYSVGNDHYLPLLESILGQIANTASATKYSNPKIYASYILSELLELSKKAEHGGNTNNYYRYNAASQLKDSLPQDIKDIVSSKFLEPSSELLDSDNAYLQSAIATSYFITDAPEEAVKYFKLSANHGNTSAQRQLGLCYKRGIGTEIDLAESFKYLKLSADNGNQFSQNNVALCYKDGHGVKKSSKKSFEYFKLAADQGNNYAQHKVALCYKDGHGVKKSSKKSFEYFKLAADQGNNYAQHNLGYGYDHGLGVKQDFQKAQEYYELAANQGNSNSQNNLGYLYYHGLGVYKNIAHSTNYFLLSAKQGNVAAARNLMELTSNKLKSSIAHSSLEDLLDLYKIIRPEERFLSPKSTILEIKIVSKIKEELCRHHSDIKDVATFRMSKNEVGSIVCTIKDAEQSLSSEHDRLLKDYGIEFPEGANKVKFTIEAFLVNVSNQDLKEGDVISPLQQKPAPRQQNHSPDEGLFSPDPEHDLELLKPSVEEKIRPMDNQDNVWDR
jgi:TPR repeat protein